MDKTRVPENDLSYDGNCSIFPRRVILERFVTARISYFKLSYDRLGALDLVLIAVISSGSH